MVQFLKGSSVAPLEFARCHDGEGTLRCTSLMDTFASQAFSLFHVDTIPAGVSIGLHAHTGNEEIYYLVSGRGVMQCDGEVHDMEPGDISVCTVGHAHSFRAVEDSVLIVVGSTGK